MTPDQAAVAEKIADVPHDATVVDTLLREAKVALTTPADTILGDLVRTGAAELAGRDFVLTRKGREQLYAFHGWDIDGPPMWQQRGRMEIRRQFTAAKAEDTDAHVSPSNRYHLDVTVYSNAPSRWSYTRGIVSTADGSEVAVVERNFGMFPFAWAEDHPSGHDYLVCGEDYQGQTVIELDTGNRVDHLPSDAESGAGFCWARHFVSPDKPDALGRRMLLGMPLRTRRFRLRRSDGVALPRAASLATRHRRG